MNYFPKFSKKDKEIFRIENQKAVIKNSVSLFSWQMENELLKHLDRPGWRGETIAYLLQRLGEEVAELCEAISSNQPRETVNKEGADVGNFAMMITDIYREKHK